MLAVALIWDAWNPDFDPKKLEILLVEPRDLWKPFLSEILSGQITLIPKVLNYLDCLGGNSLILSPPSKAYVLNFLLLPLFHEKNLSLET